MRKPDPAPGNLGGATPRPPALVVASTQAGSRWLTYLLLAALGVGLSSRHWLWLAAHSRVGTRREVLSDTLSDREGNPPPGPLVLPALSGGRVGGWGWARVREVDASEGCRDWTVARAEALADI
jgi:hypothetical protein